MLLGANAAIFDELRHGSLYLKEVQQAYKRAVNNRRIRTFNFFEQRRTRLMPFYSEILVPEADATFGPPDHEVSNIGMPTDHSGLNKFASDLSPGYDKIRLALADILVDVSAERRTYARSRHVISETINDCYAERPGLSNQLEALMQTPNTSSGFAHTAVLLGAGGMGKTQLVLRYLQSHDHEYDLVLWIDARTENSVKMSFRRCCKVLRLGIGASRGAASIDSPAVIRTSPEVIALHKWLRHMPTKWLMVIDSADDLTWNIRDAIPPRRDRDAVGSLIMTSQDSRCADLLGHASGRITVEAMNIDEAVELLSSTVGVTNPTEQVQRLLEYVASQLGEFALALDIAGTTIKNSIIDNDDDGDVVAALQRYVDDLRNHKDEMLKSNDFQGLHHSRQTVWTAWDTAFAAITRLSTDPEPLPLMLLVFMSFLAPSSVQTQLFELASMDALKSGIQAALPRWFGKITLGADGAWDKYWYTQAIAVLRRFHLIRKAPHSPETFTMHDLIRWRATKVESAAGPAILSFVVVADLCRFVRNRPSSVDVRSTLLPHTSP
ncbi:hypothetical protein LTR95_013323 [Oleoguttula sp. CCFEE 5521]